MKMKTENETLETAVLIPLIQAVVTGTLLSVLTGITVTIFWNERSIEYALVVFAVSSVLGWFAYRADWSRKPMLEPELTQEFQNETVSLALTWNDGQAGEMLYGVDWVKFSTWAVAVVRGKSMGENHWTGTDAVFRKGEYHRMIDNLLEKGIIRRKGQHHSIGYELTGKGRALCNGIERQRGAPLLDEKMSI
jgi:hypothetical protein